MYDGCAWGSEGLRILLRFARVSNRVSGDRTRGSPLPLRQASPLDFGTMVTDRRPSRGSPRQEYDDSTRLTEIHVPRSQDSAATLGLIECAREEERREPLVRICKELLDGFAEFYAVTAPNVKLLGVRPHRTREGRLARELLGDYSLDSAEIRLWTRTAMMKKWTSSRTTLSTLCHE